MTEDNDIKVNDRRRFNTDGSERPDSGEVEAPKKVETQNVPPKQEFRTPPEINFVTFVLSLATSVQISLGLIPHPVTKKPQPDLIHAKQTIDILGILEEKTKGNLDADEAQLLKQILFELRMKYVELNPSSPKV